MVIDAEEDAQVVVAEHAPQRLFRLRHQPLEGAVLGGDVLQIVDGELGQGLLRQRLLRFGHEP